MPQIFIAPYIASYGHIEIELIIFSFIQGLVQILFLTAILGQNSCLFSLNLCEITCMILRARNGPIASLVNIDKQTRVKARGDRLSHLFIVLA